jgi:hypothetical protein
MGTTGGDIASIIVSHDHRSVRRPTLPGARFCWRQQLLPWQPCRLFTTYNGCTHSQGAAASRPTYPSPSSTHRQFTGGREFFCTHCCCHMPESTYTIAAALLTTAAAAVFEHRFDHVTLPDAHALPQEAGSSSQQIPGRSRHCSLQPRPQRQTPLIAVGKPMTCTEGEDKQHLHPGSSSCANRHKATARLLPTLLVQACHSLQCPQPLPSNSPRCT